MKEKQDIQGHGVMHVLARQEFTMLHTLIKETYFKIKHYVL